MTVEELLKPRYKVIALWPNTGFKLGDIISDVRGSAISFYNQYPHLFQKLEWWEERDIKDMPEYVKFQGKVCKIKEYVFKDWVTAFYTDDLKFGVIKHVDQTTPATEAEYNEYIKTKTPQP